MIRKVLITSVAILSFTAAGGALASGDPEAGFSKSALCHGCHGEKGFSIAPNFPNLAGQKSGYIIKQVTDFQKNHRYNDTMSPMALSVTSQQDLQDIAAYFSSQKSMKAMIPGSDKKKIDQGKKIFEKGNPRTGLYGCINCHGPKGRGKSPTNQVFPVIGGQNKDYLVKQLTDFKAGDRKNDPAGMMGDIAKKLSDAELDAVTEYLSSL
jgi:cytochrome c553